MTSKEVHQFGFGGEEALQIKGGEVRPFFVGEDVREAEGLGRVDHLKLATSVETSCCTGKI